MGDRLPPDITGELLMGSDEGDAGENPVHEVEISRPFYLEKYEVTQEHWRTEETREARCSVTFPGVRQQ